MTEFINIIILAVVQGLTEFLPVSSSGHLVLTGRLIGSQQAGNMAEVVLHAGTFIAVLIFFRSKIMTLTSGFIKKDPKSLRYIGALAVGTLPVIAVFLLAGDLIERFFDQPIIAAGLLCVTGLILLSLLFCRPQRRDLSVSRGFFIGIAQAVALLPGISRSGTTIVTARHLGLDPEESAEFSFLLSLPAMIGAIIIKSISLFNGSESVSLLLSATGIIVSAAVGYIALALLLKVIRKGKLWVFGIYCILAGLFSIALLKLS